MNGTGRVRKVRNGLPHLAEVDVTVTLRDEHTQVEVVCSGTGWSAQGYIEEASPVGYDAWKAGAREGALFALRAVGLTGAVVVVTRIAGMTTDTNPSIVGLAAASAVWDALGARPPANAVERIEAIAFASWSNEPDRIPTYD